MGTNLEQRRVFLYNNFGKILKASYGGKLMSFFDLNAGEEAPFGFGWGVFVDAYFKDASTVNNFFKDIKKVFNAFKDENKRKTIQGWVPNVDLTKDDPKNLFVDYACDITGINKVSYCLGNTDDMKHEEIIGNYTTDVKQIGDITITTENEFEGSSSVKYVMQILKFIDSALSSQYSQMDLVPKGGRGYDLKYKNITIGDIQFDEDKNGFRYKILKHSGVAKRKDFGDVKTNVKPETKKNDVKSTETEKKEPRGTTLQNTKIIKNVKIKLHSCDNSMFENGGFELGCENKLIGDLNEKLFGDRMYDGYSEMLQNYLTSLNCFTQDNLTKKLNTYVWNRAMKIGTIKESVKKVLREHINKKK